MNNRYFRNLLYVFIWLLLWQLGSILTGLEMIFPGPVNVLFTLCEMLKTKQFYKVLITSLCSIGTGFLFAFFMGVLLGTISAFFTVIRDFLKPAVLLMKSLPVAAFIILVLMWFGSSKVSIIISFTVTFPIIYHGIYEGMKNADNKMIEMAEVYRVSKIKKMLYVYMPSAHPFLNSALKTSAGMCWKAGVSAEVIGLVNNSIGENMYYAKLYIMSSELFAWSFSLIVISYLFEKIICFAIDCIFRKFCGI